MDSTVKTLYIGFAACLVLTVIPNELVAMIAGLVFIALLIGAYVIRGQIEKDERDNSAVANHATHIIASIWASATLSLVTIGIASAYMLPRVQYEPFQLCPLHADQLMSASHTQIMAMIEPCLNDFMLLNKELFVHATLIAGGPIMFYLAYRLYKGIRPALKGELLPKPKSWL